MQAPLVYRYHDYRLFLRDRFNHLKKTRKGYTVQKVAQDAGLTSSLLSMVLNGERTLGASNLKRLFPYLDLDTFEKSYLECIRNIAETESHEERLKSLQKIQKSKAYQRINPKEFEVYRYLTRWYYVAIREMALLEDFRDDPKWIQSRLRDHISRKEIADALKFLYDRGYIKKEKDGTNSLPEPNLECFEGIYRLALAQFYNEMLDKAARSIRDIPRDKRKLSSYTLALSANQYSKVKDILDEAYDRVASLVEERDAAEDVYHIELIAFPLTQRKSRILDQKEKKTPPNRRKAKS